MTSFQPAHPGQAISGVTYPCSRPHRRTRVDVRGHALDQTDPKTKSADRTLPIPDGLLAELKAAKARQAAEQLAIGDAYSDHGHVVCNEAGAPYHPTSPSRSAPTFTPSPRHCSRRHRALTAHPPTQWTDPHPRPELGGTVLQRRQELPWLPTPLTFEFYAGHQHAEIVGSTIDAI